MIRIVNMSRTKFGFIRQFSHIIRKAAQFILLFLCLGVSLGLLFRQLFLLFEFLLGQLLLILQTLLLAEWIAGGGSDHGTVF